MITPSETAHPEDVSPPAWMLPHKGLYWYDLAGQDEAHKKILHALFRRGLYDPAEARRDRSRRLFLAPRGRPTSHVLEARRQAKAEAAALEIEAESAAHAY